MKFKNENGFAHLQLIIGLVLLVGVVSFAGYRVGQNQSKENQESSDDNKPETVQEIKAVEAEEQTEVVIPEEVKEIAPAPVEEKTTVKTETPTEKKKSDKTWLKMTKVSSVQTGGVIDVVSTLPQALTGTCTFKLYQEGYEKVYTSVAIHNSTNCSAQLNVASLPVYTGWTLYGWFDSSDGKVSASQPEEAISIQTP